MTERQRLKDIFHAALERAPAEREAFLEEACAQNPELRQEVESLLASHGQAGSFLEGHALEYEPMNFDAVYPSEHQPTLSHEESWAGQRIGPYQILREIGRGGMGTVYLAVRADGQYKKKVAIKIVSRGMDTDLIIRRFRAERQILASLDHANIARLFDGGTTTDGRPYFVMEHIDGKPIDEYCDSEKLSTADRLKLFRTVCSALQYAHENFVLHRDIKPANILVTAQRVPKLLDFGIAKIVKPELFSQTTQLTLTLQRLMTPPYASPEQVRGEPITTASDVYQLGVLLYQLLTGHRPYHFRSRSPDEIARVICNENPEKPSTAVSRVEEFGTPDGTKRITPEVVSRTREGEPEKLRRRLSGDLDTIVLSAMHKDPQRRYASVKQFSEDIRRHLNGLPVSARKDTLPYRASKFIRRHQAGVLAGVTIAILTLVIVAIAYRLLLRAPSIALHAETKSLAVLPLVNLSGDPAQDYFADGMTDALISNLSQIGALRVISRTSMMHYKAATKTIPEIARELKVHAVVEGSLIRSGNRIRFNVRLVNGDTSRQLWAANYERELQDILSLLNEAAHAVAGEIKARITSAEQLRLESGRPISHNVFDNYLRGRYYWNKRTEENIRKAIQDFRNALDEDPAFAPAYAGLADCYNQLATVFIGQPPAEMKKLAAAAARRALEIDKDLAEAQASLAHTELYQWDWAAAEQGFKRAIELEPSYAPAHLWYAHSLVMHERFEEAVAEVKQAYELDPLSPIMRTQVGWILRLARRTDEAIEQYRAVLETDPNYVWALWQLGIAYTDKSMFKQAIATLERALTVSSRHPAIMGSLGIAYARSGRKTDAQGLLDELIQQSKQRYIPPVCIAWIYLGLDEKDQALQWLEKAFQERSNSIAYLKTSSEYHALRSDPRFQDMLRRMSLTS